jgi:hypothetical protein
MQQPYFSLKSSKFKVRGSKFKNCRAGVSPAVSIGLSKNYLQIEIQDLIENQRDLKSPFGKGGFREISGA